MHIHKTFLIKLGHFLIIDISANIQSEVWHTTTQNCLEQLPSFLWTISLNTFEVILQLSRYINY